jgi:hypothetical protein
MTQHSPADDPTRQGVTYFEYDRKKYPFIELVEELFGVPLRDLHLSTELQTKPQAELHTNDDDDKTFFHRKFYNRLDEGWLEFTDAYDNFIKDVICPMFGVDEIIVQQGPSFRVQLPDNIAVGGNDGDDPEQYGWHRDSDDNYNHPTSERNFIVPLTEADDTASVWIETEGGSNEFTAARMRPGEFFRFNGATCKHGNKPNATGKSRLSFDFRVVLPEEYDPNFHKKSKSGNKKFVIGGYYKKLSRNPLLNNTGEK